MKDRKKYTFFDGHNDCLSYYFLKNKPVSAFFEKENKVHLDYPKAMKGGFAGGMFALFAPNAKKDGDKDKSEQSKTIPSQRIKPIDHEYAKKVTEYGITCLKQLEQSSEGRVKIVTDISQIKHCLRNNTIAAVLHFEGAEAIDKECSNLQRYYDEGLRSLGLVWSRQNCFGQGVGFKFPGFPDQGPGLTVAGKNLVAACNILGIVVDVSHLNEAGFWDVAQMSTAPLVASHSNAHALSASPRNLTDKQLDAIGKSGGIVGINFCVEFLRKDGKKVLDTSLDVVVDHIRYIADRIGVEHIGFGSDFDGADIPAPIGNAAGMPGLIERMSDLGFSDDEIQAIALDNWLRVLEKTWTAE